MRTLDKLTPVTYAYKAAPDEHHVGFIAEDAPDLVATLDHKGMSAMDIVAVLTKVVQQQKSNLAVKDARIDALESRLDDVERLRGRSLRRMANSRNAVDWPARNILAPARFTEAVIDRVPRRLGTALTGILTSCGRVSCVDSVPLKNRVILERWRFRHHMVVVPTIHVERRALKASPKHIPADCDKPWPSPPGSWRQRQRPRVHPPGALRSADGKRSLSVSGRRPL